MLSWSGERLSKNLEQKKERSGTPLLNYPLHSFWLPLSSEKANFLLYNSCQNELSPQNEPNQGFESSFKKTQVLKKNLLWFWAIVLNTSQAHWSGAMEWNLGHSFFLERSSIFGAERKKELTPK